MEAQAKIQSLIPPPLPVIAEGEGPSVAPPLTNASPAGQILDDLIRDCLAAAASRWSEAANCFYYRHTTRNSSQEDFTGKVAVALQIIEEALVSGELKFVEHSS